MLPLLCEYASSGQPLSIKQLLPVMAQRLNLSEEDLAERLPSGRQGLLHNRLHWAKTYMARAGLIGSPSRGLAQITERGRAVLRENPDRIDGVTLAQFPEFGLVTVLRRSPERLELATGDRRDDEAFR
jgi:restriction system protein